MLENARLCEQAIQRRRKEADNAKQLKNKLKAQKAQAARSTAALSGLSHANLRSSSPFATLNFSTDRAPLFNPFSHLSTNTPDKTPSVFQTNKLKNPFAEFSGAPKIPASFSTSARPHTLPVDFTTNNSLSNPFHSLVSNGHDSTRKDRSMSNLTAQNESTSGHRPAALSVAPSTKAATHHTAKKIHKKPINGGPAVAPSIASVVDAGKDTGANMRSRSPSLEIVGQKTIVSKFKTETAISSSSPSKKPIKNQPSSQTTSAVLKETALNTDSSSFKRRYNATYDPRSNLQAHVEDDEEARSPKRARTSAMQPLLEPVSPQQSTFEGGNRRATPYGRVYPPSSAKWSCTTWNGKP